MAALEMNFRKSGEGYSESGRVAAQSCDDDLALADDVLKERRNPICDEDSIVVCV